MAALESALPYRSVIAGVGLDSSENGHQPVKFKAVCERARAEGFWAVAHAGEEGPPAYIAEALDPLKVRRVDHGVRCLEDAKLVERLRRERVPLTVCPLSNVRPRVFPTIEDHSMRRLIAAGLLVTVARPTRPISGLRGRQLPGAGQGSGACRRQRWPCWRRTL